MRLVLALASLLIPGLVSAAPSAVLVTMGTGDALFSKFGHAAVCIVDSELPGGGLCYNYGTSDFSRPVGLGWDVVNGRAKFWVSVSDWITMLVQFQAQDRTIYAQPLPLDEDALGRLMAALENDALPENREYIYSHFLDNCSTRPRDLIDAVTGQSLRQSTLVDARTYRDFAREGFASAHWALVPAGDLILGRWVDQEIDLYEQMFIPSVLRRAVSHELGSEPQILFEAERPSPPGDVTRSLRLFWLVVALCAVVAWLSRAGARGLAALSAVVGVLLWTAAVASTWPELRVNELLLVFVPFDGLLALGFVSLRYVRVRLVMCVAVLALIVAGILVQPLWPYWTLVTAMLAAFWWRARRDILAR